MVSGWRYACVLLNIAVLSNMNILSGRRAVVPIAARRAAAAAATVTAGRAAAVTAR